MAARHAGRPYIAHCHNNSNSMMDPSPWEVVMKTRVGQSIHTRVEGWTSSLPRNWATLLRGILIRFLFIGCILKMFTGVVEYLNPLNEYERRYGRNSDLEYPLIQLLVLPIAELCLFTFQAYPRFIEPMNKWFNVSIFICFLSTTPILLLIERHFLEMLPKYRAENFFESLLDRNYFKGTSGKWLKKSLLDVVNEEDYYGSTTPGPYNGIIDPQKEKARGKIMVAKFCFSEQIYLLSACVGHCLLSQHILPREQLLELLCLHIFNIADILELVYNLLEQKVHSHHNLSMNILYLVGISRLQLCLHKTSAFVLTSTSSTGHRLTLSRVENNQHNFHVQFDNQCTRGSHTCEHCQSNAQQESAAEAMSKVSIRGRSVCYLLWDYILPLLLQDVPFLLLRFNMYFRYDVQNFGIVFFAIKNVLCIVIQALILLLG